MNTILTATIIAATLASGPVGVNVDVAQVYEDVRVIRRVASVAGDNLPDRLLLNLIDENVERLRARIDERNYAYAKWTRQESSRVSDTETVKKEKDGRSTIVEIKAPLAYRFEIAAPERRYIAARNRPITLDSVITEYTNSAGIRKTEPVDLGRTLNPGERQVIDLPEIGWNVVARLKATSAEDAIGNGTIEVSLSVPTLVDAASSPYAEPTANLLAMKTAIIEYDILEVRRLCDATTAHFDETSRQARSTVRPVGGTIQPARIYSELQRIEDLLTGDDQQQRDGMDKLHQLIIYLRP